MNDSDSFFSKGGAASESRPRAVNPKTGQEQSWQRASNYAAPLDNPHGLITWKLRELVMGISQRPDLARMLLTGAVISDNAKADEVIAQAHAVQAIDAKANEGTAVHAALSGSFLGMPIVEEYRPHITAFAETLRRNGLKPVATEVEFLNTKLGVLGHVDWIVETTDGRFLVLDVKTGKLGDSKRKFAVQCVCYAHSDFMDNGSTGWIPIPFKIDPDEAILAHVDPETGATALYRVDLVLGFYGATLAERVREWSKTEVLSPYTPHPGAPTSLAAHVETAVTQRPLDSTNQAAQAGSPTAPTASPTEPAGQVGAVYSSAHQQTFPSETALEQAHENQSSPQVETSPKASPERTFDELMKLDKAPLQMIIKNEFGGTDIAHNRRWLARWIVAAQNGMDHKEAAKYAAAKDDSVEVVKTGAKPFIPQPQTGPGSTEFLLRSIGNADSVAALEAIRANVVERRGDQAWTDELAQAARERAAELGATAYQHSSPIDEVLDAIRKATEPAHIASLWSEVTVGGTVPENWTHFKDVADQRMHEIQQAIGAPPANPYA